MIEIKDYADMKAMDIQQIRSEYSHAQVNAVVTAVYGECYSLEEINIFGVNLVWGLLKRTRTRRAA